MRTAIVSDLHANLWAWQATEAALADLAIDRVVCLGDVVGYGSRPAEVLDATRRLATATVLGNHDAVVAGLYDASVFNHRAREVIEWTTDQLDRSQIDWLEALPLWWRPEDECFLAVHAEVSEPGRFGYVTTVEEARANFDQCPDRLVFFGHTHFAGVFSLDEESGEVTECLAEDFQLQPGQRYLVNPGSVGDPRTAEAQARFALFDSKRDEVTFHAVPFDLDAVRADVAASGLPHRQAFLRLIDGETRPTQLAAEQDFRPDDTHRVTARAQPTPAQSTPARLSRTGGPNPAPYLGQPPPGASGRNPGGAATLWIWLLLVLIALGLAAAWLILQRGL